MAKLDPCSITHSDNLYLNVHILLVKIRAQFMRIPSNIVPEIALENPIPEVSNGLWARGQQSTSPYIFLGKEYGKREKKQDEASKLGVCMYVVVIRKV